MKRIFTLVIAVTLGFCAKAQTYKYFLDNNLQFKSSATQNIPYPFVGGFLSPQFSNIDFNGDNKKDLFIFDRASGKVLTYTFDASSNSWAYAPQYEFAFPRLFSWALLVDYNGDGKEDLFTAANPYYYPQAVSVYKNTSSVGKISFTLVEAQLTSDINIPDLPESPIYWINDDISAVNDVDGDGDIDILAFDASAASITMYRNEAKENGYPLDSLTFRNVDDCWGAFRESFLDRSVTLGVPCFGSRKYNKTAGHAGSTMLLVDMNNDGDKDLILGDASYSELTLLTNGKNNFSWPYDTMSAYDTVFPRNTTKTSIYTFPATFYVDIDNDGVKDLMAAPNVKAAGKGLNQVWYYRNTGSNNLPNFSFVQNNFLQDKTVDFGSGAAPAFIDVDGDGDQDLIIAHRGDFEVTLNAADRLSLFKNVGTAKNPVFQWDSDDYLGLKTEAIRDLKPTFGDLNGDGKQDMLVGDADGRLNYYQNNGGTTLSLAAPVKNYMKIDVGTSAAPQVIDLDKDNLLDLVVGTGGGYIQYFKNKGTVTNPAFDSVPTLDTLGDVYVNDFYYYYELDNNGNPIDTTQVFDTEGFAAPHITDLNNDGNWELLVGSKMGKLWLFNDIENNWNGGTFKEVSNFAFNNLESTFGGINFGLRILPVAAQLSDTNSKKAIVIGNFRGGINYLRSDSGVVTSIRLPEEKLHIGLYPNPTNGEVSIIRNLDQFDGKLHITATDMLGRVVYRNVIETGVAEQTINLSAVQNGIYYIQVTDGQHFKAVEKVTVLR